MEEKLTPCGLMPSNQAHHSKIGQIGGNWQDNSLPVDGKHQAKVNQQ
jgi:hypothetical protein